MFGIQGRKTRVGKTNCVKECTLRLAYNQFNMC